MAINRTFGLALFDGIGFVVDCMIGGKVGVIGFSTVNGFAATAFWVLDDRVRSVCGSESFTELPPTRTRYFPAGSTRCRSMS